jgi:hypothetical protein
LEAELFKRRWYETGQIRFGAAGLGNESARAYYPATTPEAGDVWLNRDRATNLQLWRARPDPRDRARSWPQAFVRCTPQLAAGQDHFLFTALSATSFDMLVPRRGTGDFGQESRPS